MRVPRLSLVVLLLVAICLPEIAEGARIRRRNPRNTGDMFKDYVDIHTELAFPFTHAGTAMVNAISGWYQPYDHFGFGTDFSWALNEDRLAAPGGFVLKLFSGTGTVMKVRKGFGASANVYGLVGINPFSAGSEGRRSVYAIGQAHQADWLGFMPDSAVLGFDAVGTLWLSQTMFWASCGPRFALPFDEHDPDGNLTAIRYNASFASGWGNWRGSYGFVVGVIGLKEFTRRAEHLVGLQAGIWAWIGDIDLQPFVSVWAPILGEDAGIEVSLIIGVTWSLDARAPKADLRDPLPPSPTSAFAPRLP